MHVMDPRPTDSSIAVLRGGGCQGAVVFEQIQFVFSRILVWDENEKIHPILSDLPRFHPDFKSESLKGATEVCCYVAVGSGAVRKNLVESVERVFQSSSPDLRLTFPSVIHKTAVVSPSAKIGSGCFVGPFALINTNAKVGDFCLINSAALVEHDCVLESYVTVNPGAILLGTARLETLATQGANATVRENRSVVAGTMIGMGASVVRDINGPLHGFWGGVPAKPVFQRAQVDEQAKNVRIRWCFQKPFSSQRLLQYLQQSLEKGHLTNDGPLQAVVTAKLKSLVRTNRDVLMACSGTAALHALVTGHALMVGKPLRWATQAFTFPSSIQGPLAQAKVCDIDPTLNGPCMRFLEEAKDDFDGIIVTNVFGMQVEIVEYERWCIRCGKLLIFDNAASPLGFIEDGRSIHDVGDGAIISLHETKPFGRGEGGAIIASRELAPFVHQAMNFGYDIPNQVRVPNRQASNWRMSDFAAAAICDHFDTMIDQKWEAKLQELTRSAVEQLEQCGKRLAYPIRYPTVLGCLFVRLLDGSNAEAICQRLNSHGIEAKHYYTPLVSRSEAPNAWNLYDTTVCLPFHLDMSREDLRKMIMLL